MQSHLRYQDNCLQRGHNCQCDVDSMFCCQNTSSNNINKYSYEETICHGSKFSLHSKMAVGTHKTQEQASASGWALTVEAETEL